MPRCWMSPESRLFRQAERQKKLLDETTRDPLGLGRNPLPEPGLRIAPQLSAFRGVLEEACIRRCWCLFTLAVLNYHDVKRALPPRSTGTNSGAVNNGQRLAAFVFLTPFYEQQALWNVITSNCSSWDGGTIYPPQGPNEWTSQYPPWCSNIPVLHCPSEIGNMNPGQPGPVQPQYPPGMFAANTGGTIGRTNYCFSQGDTINGAATVNVRGAFGYNSSYSLATVIDGTTNTVALSERAYGVNGKSIRGGVGEGYPAINTNPSLCLQAVDSQGFYTNTGNQEAGARWTDGYAVWTSFNTVLPPNSPSCCQSASGTSSCDNSGGVYSVTSYHPSGVNASMLDGSVRFVSEQIDVGNTTLAEVTAVGTPSNYGVWGRMGTINGGESITPP
jgi:prepilin-type processing-associated H-X9-DG protein